MRAALAVASTLSAAVLAVVALVMAVAAAVGPRGPLCREQAVGALPIPAVDGRGDCDGRVAVTVGGP